MNDYRTATVTYLPWLLSAITIWMTLMARQQASERLADRARQPTTLADLDLPRWSMGAPTYEPCALDRLRAQPSEMERHMKLARDALMLMALMPFAMLTVGIVFWVIFNDTGN